MSGNRQAARTTRTLIWLIFITNVRWTVSASLSVVQPPSGGRVCLRHVAVVYDGDPPLNGATSSPIFVQADDLESLQRNSFDRQRKPVARHLLGSRNKTECQPGDPSPLPNQLPAVTLPSAIVPATCPWRWQCYKDPTRLLTTWQEAVLAGKTCASTGRAGICQLNYMDGLVFRKADCKTEDGQTVWRASIEPRAVSASCLYTRTEERISLPSMSTQE